MSIHQMPPEMLSIILFDKDISLKQRIALRRVSAQWLDLIEDHLKKQHKLVIYCDGGLNERQQRSNTDLVIRDLRFRGKFIERITRLFPSIADLKMETYSSFSYRHLPKLITSYRSTLTSIYLTGYQGYYFYERLQTQSLRATPRLITALNSLPNLTSLHLSGYTFTQRLLPSLAPTLARLERFGFDCRPDRPGVFRVQEWQYQAFGRLFFGSLTDRCTHLELDRNYINWEGTTQLGTSLTTLVTGRFILYDTLDRITGEFTALRNLRISFVLNNAHLRLLARLQQLTDLEVSEVDIPPNRLEAPNIIEPRLASLRRLQVNFSRPEILFFEDQFDRAARQFTTNLPAWMPALERLTIQCFPGYYQNVKDALEDFPVHFELIVQSR